MIRTHLFFRGKRVDRRCQLIRTPGGTIIFQGEAPRFTLMGAYDSMLSWLVHFAGGGGCGSGVFWLAVAPDRFCEYFLVGINKEMANWLAELALARFAITFY